MFADFISIGDVRTQRIDWKCFNQILIRVLFAFRLFILSAGIQFFFIFGRYEKTEFTYCLLSEW